MDKNIIEKKIREIFPEISEIDIEFDLPYITVMTNYEYISCKQITKLKRLEWDFNLKISSISISHEKKIEIELREVD